MSLSTIQHRVKEVRSQFHEGNRDAIRVGLYELLNKRPEAFIYTSPVDTVEGVHSVLDDREIQHHTVELASML